MDQETNASKACRCTLMEFRGLRPLYFKRMLAADSLLYVVHTRMLGLYYAYEGYYRTAHIALAVTGVAFALALSILNHPPELQSLGNPGVVVHLLGLLLDRRN